MDELAPGPEEPEEPEEHRSSCCRRTRDGSAEHPHVDVHRRWALAAPVLCTNFVFMAALSVLNLVIPDIAADFGVTERHASWTVLLPHIVVAAVNPAAGKVADVLGRKEVWVGGTVLNIISLALAGRAQTMGQLLLARLLCGLGTALEQPSGTALMQAAFSPEEQPTIIAWSTANSTIAPMLGMLLGGWLAELYGWRFLFLAPVVPSILACIITASMLPPSRSTGHTLSAYFKTFDVEGTVALCVSTTSLLLAITGDPSSRGSCFLTFVFSTLVLWHVERKAADPIIPGSIFTNSDMVMAHAWRFVYFTIHFGNIMMVALYLRDVGRMGAGESAFWNASRPIVSSVTMVITGRWLQSDKGRALGHGWLLMAAAIIGVAGQVMAVVFFWNGGVDKAFLIAMLTVQGLVAASSSVTLRVLILEPVSETDRANVNGVLNTAISVANSLGSALGVGLPAMGAVDRGEQFESPQVGMQQRVRGYRAGAALLLLGYMAFLFLPVALSLEATGSTARRHMMTVGAVGLGFALLLSGTVTSKVFDAPVDYEAVTAH